MRKFLSQQNYKVLNLLGEGASSQVYRALRFDSSSEFQEMVAIKLLKSRKLVSAWKQEYKILRKAQSPYCVRALGFERINSYPAIVMDYVEGASLHQISQTDGFSLNEVKYIVEEIKKAVDSLHSCEIVHGDLSPKNILVNTSGCLRLIDYGLQGRLNGKLFATKEFAHPQLFEKNEKPTRKTDQFSIQKVEEYLLRQVCLKPINGSGIESSSQIELSRKVARLLEESKDVAVTERALSNKKRYLTNVAMTIVLSGIAVLPGQSSNQYNPLLVNKISIRTNKSFKIYLNKRFIGSPPLSFYFSEREVELKAISQKASYKRVLTRSQNAHRVLNDSFFTK